MGIRIGILEKIQERKLQVVSLVFAAGLFFVLLGWVVSARFFGVRLTLNGIAYIHQEQPGLYFLDVLPLAWGVFYAVRYRRQRRREEALEQDLERNERAIARNAAFAKEIGEGNYQAEFQIEGEDDVLGASLLRMRDNLVETNRRETDSNWITKGKDEVAYVLRLHTNVKDLTLEVLRKLVEYIHVVQGTLYIYDEKRELLESLATYAYAREKYLKRTFKIGEGLLGECAYEREIVYRTEIPEGYTTISSGILGDQRPRSLLLVPLVTNDMLQGVVEFASVRDEFSGRDIRFLSEVGEIIARTVYNLRISQRTETLLHEAQHMTQELRKNEEKLRQNAEEMQQTHEELAHANARLESKIKEAENAQRLLHSLLENASEVIAIYNEQNQIKYISPSVTKILGYTPDEMMDGKDHERLTQQGLSQLNHMFEQLLELPRVPVTIQYVFMKKDGQKVSLEATGRNMLDDPAIKGIILNSRDITERLRAEKEERMKSRMQSLSENSLDMIIRLSLDQLFHYANPVVERYLGLRPDELLNHDLSEVSIPEVLSSAFQRAIEGVRGTQEKWEEEVTVTTAEGPATLRLAAIPEFEDEVLETVLLVGHDITEAKRIESEIQDKSRKITESINYAQRIQGAILPDVKLIQQYFPRSFMYYKPRDVVSGDFPWFFRKDDYLYIAAVDCTGHGVPGALLSFIGFFTLNNVVDHDASYSAAEVLDNLHAGVRKTLRQDRPDADARDGMDIALCKYAPKTQTLEFAGAHRPLYHLRGEELTEYKGDRKAIGGIPHAQLKEDPFTNYTIEIARGDRVFFFSDGLPDQLGGVSGMKKYSPKHIRDVIVEKRDLSMPKLEQFFADDYAAHRGQHKQLDDVLFIGIEF